MFGGFILLTALCDIPEFNGWIKEQLSELLSFYVDVFF